MTDPKPKSSSESTSTSRKDTPEHDLSLNRGTNNLDPALADDPTLLGAGKITHRVEGGTFQHEPRAEDYPAAAKVAPPMEQLNPSLAQAVGTPAPLPQAGPNATDLEAAQDATQESIDAAMSKTHARFDALRKDREESGEPFSR